MAILSIPHGCCSSTKLVLCSKNRDLVRLNTIRAAQVYDRYILAGGVAMTTVKYSLEQERLKTL